MSNVEIGFINWLAPVFLHLGGYVSITPVSLLTFSVEATGYSWWPVSLTRSGHVPMSGYDDRFTSSGTVYFIIANMLNFEYWRQGCDDYYWSLRADAIFAKNDWALTNRAFSSFHFLSTPTTACVSAPMTSFYIFSETLTSVSSSDTRWAA